MQVGPVSPEIIEGDIASGVIILCDHASNAIPAEFGDLGLRPAELLRHIAYDIGAADVTRRLAAELGAPAMLSTFSRVCLRRYAIASSTLISGRTCA